MRELKIRRAEKKELQMKYIAPLDGRVIHAQNIVKKFGDLEAVKGVSFSAFRGECLGLLGPNGAGKTSMAKMIYGSSPITAGELLIFGEEITNNLRKIKARLGVVPQEDNLDPELTVMDNLLVYAGYFLINRKDAQKRADEILEFLNLVHKSNTAVNNLSGGMKRRLTLGRALINQPELLILDEPTTGLDPYARRLLWQRLRKLKETGTTMLLTTHYLEEAEQLCDRLIIMNKGQILEEGTPQELIEKHTGKYALELEIERNQDINPLLKAAGDLVKDFYQLGNNILLFTDRGNELAKLVSAKSSEMGITFFFRRLRPSNLEDVFLKLTGKTLDGNLSSEHN